MMQPLWPVQPDGARAESFTGRRGSPLLPKIPSTKSRLETSPPGAKNRISMRRSETKPGTSGTTRGLSNKETQVWAWRSTGWVEV